MADVVVPPRPQVPGHHHIGAHREAYKQVDGEVDQRGVGAHRRQGLLAGEPAHHHHVRRVEQELQQAGGHQRQGEQQDLPCQRAVYHVHPVSAPFLCCHPISPPLLKRIWKRIKQVIPYILPKNNPASGKKRPKNRHDPSRLFGITQDARSKIFSAFSKFPLDKPFIPCILFIYR